MGSMAVKRLIFFTLSLLIILVAAPGFAQEDAAGSLKDVTGKCGIIRKGETMEAKNGGRIYQGDILTTGADGAMGVVFRDDSVMSLGPKSRIAVDKFIYNPEEGNLALVTKMAKGTAAYLSGEVARQAPESTRFETPLATIGIRGTRFTASTSGYADYTRKVDGVLILADVSFSMKKGDMFVSGAEKKKCKALQSILNKINSDLPELGYNAALRIFGHTSLIAGDESYSSLVIEPGLMNKDDFSKAVNSMKGEEGITGLAPVLSAAKTDLKSMSGRKLLLVLSDFKKNVDFGDPVKAAKELADVFGDELRICTVDFGFDEKSSLLAADIAGASGNGATFKAGNLIEDEEYFSSMMTDVFYTKADVKKNLIVLMPGKDGKTGLITVASAAGVQTVDQAWHGTWFGKEGGAPVPPQAMDKDKVRSHFKEALDAQPDPPIHFFINFEVDSTILTADSEKMIAEIAAAVKNRRSVDTTLIGHADRTASRSHNIQLALNRAARVKSLLMAHGVDEGIFEIESHGEDKPLIQTKDNEANALNRRVEVIVR